MTNAFSVSRLENSKKRIAIPALLNLQPPESNEEELNTQKLTKQLVHKQQQQSSQIIQPAQKSSIIRKTLPKDAIIQSFDDSSDCDDDKEMWKENQNINQGPFVHNSKIKIDSEDAVTIFEGARRNFAYLRDM